jgi:hypothetical protein
MSKFDPDDFMQQTIDAPIADDYVLCPEGEYEGRIEDFDSKIFRTNEFTYKQGPNEGLPGEMTTANLPWVINDDKVRATLNRDKVIVFQPIILDFDDNGQLDTGLNKNVALGKVRTAVGQKDMQPWGISRLRGQGPCMVRVTHKTVKRKDGTEVKLAEVTRVVAIK